MCHQQPVKEVLPLPRHPSPLPVTSLSPAATQKKPAPGTIQHVQVASSGDLHVTQRTFAFLILWISIYWFHCSRCPGAVSLVSSGFMHSVGRIWQLVEISVPIFTSAVALLCFQWWPHLTTWSLRREISAWPPTWNPLSLWGTQASLQSSRAKR